MKVDVNEVARYIKVFENENRMSKSHSYFLMMGIFLILLMYGLITIKFLAD